MTAIPGVVFSGEVVFGRTVNVEWIPYTEAKGRHMSPMIIEWRFGQDYWGIKVIAHRFQHWVRRTGHIDGLGNVTVQDVEFSMNISFEFLSYRYGKPGKAPSRTQNPEKLV